MFVEKIIKMFWTKNRFKYMYIIVYEFGDHYNKELNNFCTRAILFFIDGLNNRMAYFIFVNYCTRILYYLYEYYIMCIFLEIT